MFYFLKKIFLVLTLSSTFFTYLCIAEDSQTTTPQPPPAKDSSLGKVVEKAAKERTDSSNDSTVLFIEEEQIFCYEKAPITLKRKESEFVAKFQLKSEEKTDNYAVLIKFPRDEKIQKLDAPNKDRATYNVYSMSSDGKTENFLHTLTLIKQPSSLKNKVAWLIEQGCNRQSEALSIISK